MKPLNQKKELKQFKASTIIRKAQINADYIAPNFGVGCELSCSYCSLKAEVMKGVSYANNVDEILTNISRHAFLNASLRKGNLNRKIEYDISYGQDFIKHKDNYNWEKIFDFFKNHSLAKAVISTKVVPYDILDYNSNKNIKLIFTLMPEKWSRILESGSSAIIERLTLADTFMSSGYDVGFCFSPIIMTENFMDEYESLFNLIKKFVQNKNIKSTGIFLKYSKNLNIVNKHINPEANKLLQSNGMYVYNNETKMQRYIVPIKKDMERRILKLHQEIIPWNEITKII